MSFLEVYSNEKNLTMPEPPLPFFFYLSYGSFIDLDLDLDTLKIIIHPKKKKKNFIPHLRKSMIHYLKPTWTILKENYDLFLLSKSPNPW